MTGHFTLSTTLSSPTLPATHEPRLFYLLVEIAANPQTPVRRAAVIVGLSGIPRLQPGSARVRLLKLIAQKFLRYSHIFHSKD